MVLRFAGGLGSLLTDDGRVVRLRPFIATGLAVALAVGILIWLLPARWQTRFRSADGSPLFAGWSLAQSIRLVPLRGRYFAILVIYTTVALAICEIPVD